jgi:N-acetyl-gamma-glutamylphosphate reductase
VTAAAIPVAVLGGTGYVAGELLRLLAPHPVFRVAAAVSTTQAGEPVVAAVYGHEHGAPARLARPAGRGLVEAHDPARRG